MSVGASAMRLRLPTPAMVAKDGAVGVVGASDAKINGGNSFRRIAHGAVVPYFAGLTLKVKILNHE